MAGSLAFEMNIFPMHREDIGMNWHLTIGRSNVTLKASASASLWEAGMGDEQKTKRQLINELAAMRQRVAELETLEAERKQVREALEKSEKSLAEAQRIAHFGNWDWDITTDELSWSDEIYRIFGLAPQEFDANYEAFLNTVHPQDREFVQRSVDQALRKEQLYSIDHRIVLPNGVERVVHEQAEVTFDESGQPVRMVGTVQDVTDRVRVEEELRQHRCHLEQLVKERTAELVEVNEQLRREVAEREWVEEALRRERALLSQMMETSPVGITLVDREGRIMFANREAEQVLGLTRDEITERTYNAPEWCITDYDSGPFPDEELPFRRVMGTARPVFDVCHAIEWPDGRRVYLSVNAAPLFDEAGQVDGIVATVENITDRKRAEEALRRRNRELALLNQVGQEIIATLELGWIAERLLQALTETIDAEGASVWLWEDEPNDWLICRAAFQHGQSRPPINLRLQPGQGVAGWVAREGRSVMTSVSDDPRFFPGIDEQIGFRTLSLLAVPLRVRDVVIGVVEAVNKRQGDFDQDDLALVETLAASAAIALDNARLIETLRGRNAELETRNEELDAFAHTVAHDLKNPLGVITGLTGVLEEDYASMPGEDLKHYLRVVAQNGRKINSIIDELLLLAVVHKLEEVEMGPLDMESIVAEAQQRLVDMIEEHQAEITLPDMWPVALGYGPWVEEIWVNYINNAIKYGGQPARVELGADFPPLAEGIEGGAVRFWVRDNGPGITLEEQSRLFTPFTRLGQVRVKGHGLGLSIVRRIAEKLGGQVGVESEMGRGSVFYFTLPSVRALGGLAISGSHNSSASAL
jgi:PAS domain S-box-containing protein